MKNVLTALVLVSGAIVSAAQADMMMRPEDMIAVKHALEGKTIEQPRSMTEKWLRFKAEQLKLGATSLKDFAAQFGDRRLKHRWNVTARKMRKLAHRFERLSVPANQKLVKNFAHMNDWMMLKAKKMALKSEQMRIIAGQIADVNAKAKMTKMADELFALSQSIEDVANTADVASANEVQETESA